MDETPPATIRFFETVQIASVLIGLAHQFSVPTVSVVDAVITAFLLLALTLLVSRGKKNWARWVIVLSFACGVVLTAYIKLSSQAAPISILSLIALLMQAAGVVLLLTRSSARWLKEPAKTASTQ